MSHRVGNNLNVILNYLDMAQQESTDEHNRSVLAQSQSMVMAVSTVHSALGNRRDEEGGLPLHDHIELLTDQILRSFREADIERDLDLDPVYTDARTLKNCVLIVNELITNACKYAFRGDGQNEILHVSLMAHPYSRGRQEVVLEVADNGPGLSSPWAGGVAEGTGFGQALVSHCAEDMNGVVDVSSDGEGTRVRVTCRVPDPRADDAPEAPEAIAGAP
jgi:two-component sensor histidine kinase